MPTHPGRGPRPRRPSMGRAPHGGRECLETSVRWPVREWHPRPAVQRSRVAGRSVAWIVGAGMMQVAWGTATDRGRFRRINEDAHLAEPPVFLVSDGMGGHAAGEVAAAIVVDEFRSRAGHGDVDSAWVKE